MDETLIHDNHEYTQDGCGECEKVRAESLAYYKADLRAHPIWMAEGTEECGYLNYERDIDFIRDEARGK